MSYDAAGNLSYDSYSPLTTWGGRTYDAENRLTRQYNTGGGVVSEYTYDADGHRARRTVGGVVTWQVYGLDGELLAEYAGGAAASAPQKEYGYRGGELLVTAEPSANIKWLVSDHLGTPRMVADLSGSLAGVTRHDYLPFGEEIGAGVGGRTENQGYGVPDGVRQKFGGGKERDSETGLDYFGERYYSSSMGRFTSIDPLGASAKRSNPQTMNRYTYVLNNPLRYIDPDGLDSIDGTEPWSRLNDTERKLLASKLTQAKDADNPTEKELAAAGTVFNDRVIVYTDDSKPAVDLNKTAENVTTVRNFVADVGGSSAVWKQIASIDRVGRNEIDISVKDNKAFIGALKSDGFYFSANESFTGHLNSGRRIGETIDDPSLHFINDRGGNKFDAHWDPNSVHTRYSLGEIAQDVILPTRHFVAALEHKEHASPQQVNEYLKRTGKAPQ